MNKLKLEIIFISISVIITLNGCKKDICEEFNLTHETMDWHFFPDLQTNYDFYNLDSNTIRFIQTEYSRTNERKVGGIQRACYPDLRTKYVSDTLQLVLENIAIYEAFKGNVQSSIYYNVDDIQSMIDVQDDIFEPYIDNRNYFKEYEIKHLDSLTINDRHYNDLTQLTIINTSKSNMEVFWVQKHNGLIGFQLENKAWLK